MGIETKFCNLRFFQDEESLDKFKTFVKHCCEMAILSNAQRRFINEFAENSFQIQETKSDDADSEMEKNKKKIIPISELFQLHDEKFCFFFSTLIQK